MMGMTFNECQLRECEGDFTPEELAWFACGEECSKRADAFRLEQELQDMQVLLD